MRFIWKQTFLRPVRECSLLISKWDATVPTNWNSPRCGLHLEVKSSFHETRKFFMRFVIDQNQILSTVNRCWLSVLCPIFQNRLSPWLSFGKIKVRSNKCFLLVTKTLFVGSDPMEMLQWKPLCFVSRDTTCVVTVDWPGMVLKIGWMVCGLRMLSFGPPALNMQAEAMHVLPFRITR